MQNKEAAHAALTRLTRLAQREPAAIVWLEQMVAAGAPDILEPAIAVALETGEPMPAVLETVARGSQNLDVAAALARHIPLETESLDEVAVAATLMLLGDPGWPADVSAQERLVRRQALRVAMARRHRAAGRVEQARALAVDAIAGLETAASADSSARSRLIDALDLLADLIGDDSPAEAVDLARKALKLRNSVDDPYRPIVEGQVRLGAALMRAEQAEEAVEVLTVATTTLAPALMAGDSYDRAKTAWSDPQDGVIRVPVNLGRELTGFDSVIVDFGLPASLLQVLLLQALPTLVRALGTTGHAPDKSLDALDTAQEALRRRGMVAPWELLVLEALVHWRVTSRSTVDIDVALALANELDRVAAEAAGCGDAELALRARTAQERSLRAAGPAGRFQLVQTLSALGQLLQDAGLAAESVEPAREALALAQEDELKATARATLLHNLSRRLGAAGRSAEAVPISAEAVELVAADYQTDPQVTPIVMASMLVTLFARAGEAGSEVEVPVSAVVEKAVLKLINDADNEPSAVLERIWRSVGGVFTALLGQGRCAAAHRLYAAFGSLADARPDDENVQILRGLMASQLVLVQVRAGDLDEARGVYDQLAAAALVLPQNDILLVEAGKAATDLIAAYDQAGRHPAAAELAANALETLRSPEYLAARTRDLGEDPEQFVATVEAYAAEAQALPADAPRRAGRRRRNR